MPAKHSAATRVNRRGHFIELQCPECAASVRVARDELIEGAVAQCRHCGIETELRQEFDTFAHRQRWFLVDPLADNDDEERRKA